MRSEILADGRALHELHHQEHFAVLFKDVEDRRYVRVIECRDPLRFLQETLPAKWTLIQLRSHPLDRNQALENGILCTVDLPHTTRTDSRFNTESAQLQSAQV